MNLETIRLLILAIGWPVLISGSIWSILISYKFYRDVHKLIYGRLVLLMIAGWLLTMYSLGIVSTGFMLTDLQMGVKIVLPIFFAWFVTMVIVFWVILRWNKEAVVLSNFYAQLEKDRDIIASERNRLAIILTSMHDVVIATGTSYSIVLFNRMAEQLTGFTASEVLGKHIDQVIKIFDSAQQISIEKYCSTQIHSPGEVVFSKKALQLLGANNKKAFVDIVIANIKGHSDSHLGWVMTCHDVTTEWQLEKMKTDFVSMAAHELRTPLTIIRGYATMLLDQYASKLDQQYSQIVGRLINSCENLKSLADDLLLTSHIEQGTFSVNIKSFDLLEVINKLIFDFSEQVKAKQLQLVVNKPAEKLPMVLADQQRIGQAVTNLLANAINYTPSGGKVTVSVSRQSNSKGRPGDFVAVSIVDTGPGIPKEALPYLFAKYFRVSESLGGGSSGTGLGLFITKSIITLHKGDIWVESEQGKGSTFTFTIPVEHQTLQSP